MAGRVEKDEPLPGVAVTRRVRQVGAEGVVIKQRPLYAFEVEDHPEIERRKEDRRGTPHLVVYWIGVTTHVVGEKVYHGLWPPVPNAARNRRLTQPRVCDHISFQAPDCSNA